MTRELDDAGLLRFSRQIMLPELDVAGQEALLGATAFVVGMGGLGSPAAMYLAAAGVGTLIIADDDDVELSNLQRQIIHDTDAIGDAKVASAARTLKRLNPAVAIETVSTRLGPADLEAQARRADVVLDATDNFTSRYAINDACWAAGTPLVSGAAIRWEGQIAVFDPRRADAPCYRCLYREGSDEALNCADNGVIAPLVGIVGACQALEAIKLLCGVGETLAGYVLYFDALYMDWRKLRLNRDPDCPTCRR
ncbi:MAG: molybdopterin-synthase adenylyltransferase MoeB [Gammaproteobacteria bacterium]|nr:molybdopterin-synthase adenylyltransferase MoeB [Gammaproteobacteria bacterium]MBK81888.1 molybdopterin-synthase adenylyltransferase MoeB [Gammaproteobacteria bacterium]|tara:strand:+ start:58 stop:813 length:756 start_codon:yes stop_codon:yes gene_type:complete